MRNVSLTRKIEKADTDQYAESSGDEDGINEGQVVTTEPAVIENTRPVRVRRTSARIQDFITYTIELHSIYKRTDL